MTLPPLATPISRPAWCARSAHLVAPQQHAQHDAHASNGQQPGGHRGGGGHGRVLPDLVDAGQRADRVGHLVGAVGCRNNNRGGRGDLSSSCGSHGYKNDSALQAGLQEKNSRMAGRSGRALCLGRAVCAAGGNVPKELAQAVKTWRYLKLVCMGQMGPLCRGGPGNASGRVQLGTACDPPAERCSPAATGWRCWQHPPRPCGQTPRQRCGSRPHGGCSRSPARHADKKRYRVRGDERRSAAVVCRQLLVPVLGLFKQYQAPLPTQPFGPSRPPCECPGSGRG